MTKSTETWGSLVFKTAYKNNWKTCLFLIKELAESFKIKRISIRNNGGPDVVIAESDGNGNVTGISSYNDILKITEMDNIELHGVCTPIDDIETIINFYKGEQTCQVIYNIRDMNNYIATHEGAAGITPEGFFLPFLCSIEVRAMMNYMENAVINDMVQKLEQAVKQYNEMYDGKSDLVLALSNGTKFNLTQMINSYEATKKKPEE